MNDIKDIGGLEQFSPSYAKDKLMEMLSDLSPMSLGYVWRPIVYAYYFTDDHDPDKLTLEDVLRYNLIGAVALDSAEDIEYLAEMRRLHTWQHLKEQGIVL